MPNNPNTMVCQLDGSPLVMSERSGIEIDYCPSCRGVWLDRGELDRIINRNAAQTAPAQPPPQDYPSRQRPIYFDDSHRHRHYKRKKSFLEELFD